MYSPTGQSGPSEVVANIPVGPNRNGPFNFTFDRNYRNFWLVRWGPDPTQNESLDEMFPSHLSVNDLGVFAVVMVFGLILVLLFMFDFVSKL